MEDVVAEAGAERGLVRAAKAVRLIVCARGRRMAARHAAAVEDAGAPRLAPRREVVPVVVGAALGARVHRAQLRVAERRRRRRTRRVGGRRHLPLAHVEGLFRVGALDRRDRAAAGAVARRAVHRAAVREPVARLPVGAREICAGRNRAGKLAVDGVRGLRLRRDVLPVDGVARRRPDGGAVGGGARDEEREQLCDHRRLCELTVSRPGPDSPCLRLDSQFQTTQSRRRRRLLDDWAETRP